MTQNWSQDVFSKGELSPMLYARTTLDGYYKSLRVARNCITYPQGAIGKRFGQKRISTIPVSSSFADSRFIRIATWDYLNQGSYNLVFVPGAIYFYFEDNLIYTLSTNYLLPSEIREFDYSVLDNQFRIGAGRTIPNDITRTTLGTATVTSFTSTTLTLTAAPSPTQTGFIQPIDFVSGVPTSITTLTTASLYYAYFTSSTTFELYFTLTDARERKNKITFTAIPGTINVNILGKFEINPMAVTYWSYPQYDFGDYPYSAINFSLSAKIGQATLTASAAFFDATFDGGTFSYGSGVAFIGLPTSTTSAPVFIQTSFDDDIITPKVVSGNDVVITKRAWDDVHGWPKVFGSYQSRALCASTRSLPNGFWASSVKDYIYFNDTFTNDADPIAYYPASNMSSQINYIAAYRSLCVFTSNGVYSTPLSQNQAITPKNFALLLQEHVRATSAYPVGMDNRIVFVSGNDVNIMDWDGINNAYNTTIASIFSDHLINNPVDQDVYIDLNKAGSRYCFIVNEDGTLVIFQSLSSEEVLGFTLADAKQSYGKAYYRQVATSFSGDSYFIMERQQAASGSTSSMTLSVGDIWTATGINLAQYNQDAVAIKLSTVGGTPPKTTPVQVDEQRYYFAVPIDNDSFYLYESMSNALTDTDRIQIQFVAETTSATVWPLETVFTLEKMTRDTHCDDFYQYSGSPASTLTVGAHFNAQEVVAVGDGYEFSGQVFNNQFHFEAHGQEREVSEAVVGHRIYSEVQPLPISLPGAAGYKQTSLVWPTHVRTAKITFVDTIGGTINGMPLQLDVFEDNQPGYPPRPMSGAQQVSIMSGWNEFKNSGIRFEHSAPYDFKITGIFYKVED